jgi:GDP/UDP-N,N'-diacetylbacillosamine 2-epimerase (hydrolysing)
MKITVLTSSRADYSIYLPLLKELRDDTFFELDLIVFGTHLSKEYGFTIQNIIDDKFNVVLRIETLPKGDSPLDISRSIGETITKFSEVWENDQSNLIIALGDRYEMFAACVAAFPFGKKIAHLHGGETTLGAIDDSLRHSISLMSQIHFVTTDLYGNKIKNLKGDVDGIYNVGALSIDNLKSLNLLTIEEFREQFNIDLSKPSILITFHPETIEFEKNEKFIKEIIDALNAVNGFQFIFTMPNADTTGNIVRKEILNFVHKTPSAIAIESFGTIGYLSCMNYCTFLMGNTSSGFVEASFFPKYVINLGNRQTGRILTPNIKQCKIEKQSILNAINEFDNFDPNPKIDIYGDGNTAKKIVAILKNIYCE